MAYQPTWLMNDEVLVKRPTTTPTQYGGAEVSLETVGTFKCRVAARAPRLTFSVPERGPEQTEMAMQAIYFTDADVRRNDVLEHTTETGTDIYRVISTTRPSVPGAYLRADATWQQPGN